MDVSHILAEQAAKRQVTDVEKDIPLDVDTGYLAVTDLNPVDEESYNADLEEYLQTTARDGVQALIASLYSLPIEQTGDGPLAKLPPPTTQLPRAKPLPKPKPPTKWEQFAKAKGIQKKTRDRKVWDEDKQEWVNRWGRDGKNKEKEVQWATEVTADADVDFNPSHAARKERKEKMDKNEKQRLQNLARANGVDERDKRKQDISKTLAQSRVSTASMGKFDRTLEGEKKLKGVKRKFDPVDRSVEDEKNASLSLISKLDPSAKSSKKSRHDGEQSGQGVLNVRKAIRQVTNKSGATAFRKEDKRRGGKFGKAKR